MVLETEQFQRESVCNLSGAKNRNSLKLAQLGEGRVTINTGKMYRGKALWVLEELETHWKSRQLSLHVYLHFPLPSSLGPILPPSLSPSLHLSLTLHPSLPPLPTFPFLSLPSPSLSVSLGLKPESPVGTLLKCLQHSPCSQLMSTLAFGHLTSHVS